MCDSQLSTVIARAPSKVERQVSINLSLAPVLHLSNEVEVKVNYYILPSAEKDVPIDPTKHLARLTEGLLMTLP